MLRPVEYEYLVRPFWSEGRFMLTRVLQELLVLGVIRIEMRKKVLNSRNEIRMRAFVRRGESQLPLTEMYDSFFLEILQEHGDMWISDLILRSHARLDRDSEEFKKKYVRPVLIDKGYLSAVSGRSSTAKRYVEDITSRLEEIEEHVKGKINQDFILPRVESLGINFVLLSKEARQKIGKALPAIHVIGSSAPVESAGSAATWYFTGMELSSFDSSFGDSSFFDGFGGGDFDGGGVDGDW